MSTEAPRRRLVVELPDDRHDLAHYLSIRERRPIWMIVAESLAKYAESKPELSTTKS